MGWEFRIKFLGRNFILLLCAFALQNCGDSTELSGDVITDPIGNAATAAPSTPTSIKLYSPSTSPGNNKTPTLSVAGIKKGNYAYIYKSSTCKTPIKTFKNTASSTTVKVKLSTLADGTYKFYAKQKAGSLYSKCKGYATYVLDTHAPVAPTITSPLEGSSTKTSTTISGACETGSTVYIEGDVSPTTTATCSGGFFTSNVNLTAGDGAKLVTIRQRDKAKNYSAYTNLNLISDNVSPTVTINQSTAQSDPTNNQVISFDVVFNEAIDPSSFSALDISNFGSASGIIWDAPTTSDNITWTITTNSIASDGTVVPALFPNAVTDIAGNGNQSSTSGDGVVTYDSSVPLVTINSPSVSSISSGNVDYAVSYAGASSINLTSGDISVITTGSVAYSVSVLDGTTSAPTIQINITGGDGIIDSVSIAAGTSQNSTGTFDTGATQGANVTVDNTAPTVAIGNPNANAINTGSINYAVSYTGAQNINLTASDVTVNTTGTVTYTKAISNGTTVNPTIIVTVTGGDGSIDSVSIAAGTSTDSVGLADAGATQGTNVSVDNTAPTVSIGSPSTTSINNGDVDYAVSYSGADSVNLLASNVSVNTSGSVTFTKSVIGGTSLNPTIRITVTSGDGAIDSISIAAGTSSDSVGNTDAGASEGTNVTVDNTAPTVSIGAPSTTLINTGDIDYAVTYTGASTVNLTSGNVTVNTSGTVSYSVSIIDGTTTAPTIRVTILGGDGSITGVQIAAGTSTDTVGNTDVGASSLVPVVVDNDAPAVVIGTPTVSVINTGNIQYAVTYSGANNSINLLPGNVSVVTTGSVSYNVSVLGGSTATPVITVEVTGGDGTVDSISIAAGTSTDTAGNTDAGATQNTDVIVDNTNPTINIGTLSVINNANKAAYGFSGSCSEDGQTVNLTAPISASTTCASSAFTFSNLDVSASADGSVTFTVDTVDAAGNTSSDSDSATKDTVAPTIAIGTLVDINNTNKAAYGFSGTCSEDGQTVNLTTPISASATCSSNAFTFSNLDVSASTDGSVTFTVDTVDAAGNTGTDLAAVTKDTSDPTVAIGAPSVVALNTGNVDYAVTYTGATTINLSTGDVTVNTTGTVTYSTTILNGTTDHPTIRVQITGGDGSIDSIAIAAGTSSDASNNVDAGASQGTDVNVDNTAPTVAIGTPSVAALNTGNVDYAVTFSGATNFNLLASNVTDNTTGTVTFSKSVIDGTTATPTIRITVTGGDGTIDSISIAAGTSSDDVGNTDAGASQGANVTVDNTDPTIAIGTLAIINNANKVSYAFSGSCSENGEAVNLTAPVSASTTCASGTYAFSNLDVSAQADGSVTFTVSTSDTVGNNGTDSASVTKDTSDPTVAIDALTDINNANKAAYNFTGTCSENGQTVSLTAPISASTTCASGSYAFSNLNLAGLTDGTITFTVSIADVAGNTGNHSDTATKDTVDPTVAIDAPSTTALNTGNVDYAVTYTGATTINLLASNVTVNTTGTVAFTKSIIGGTTATPTIRINVTGGDGLIDSVAIAAGTSSDDSANSDAGAVEGTDVTVDNTAPTVSIGTPSTNIINTGNIDYTVTYSGTSTVNLTSGNVTVDTTGAVSYSVTIINGTTTTPTLRIVISGGDGSISGVHIAAGTGTDAVGNADVGTSNLTPVVVDNDAPVVVISTPSVSVINTGNVDYPVTYTGADGSISLNAINVTVNVTGTVTFSKSIIGGTTATPTIRINVTGGDGLIDSVAIAAGTSMDSAGNTDAGASQGANVTVDNTDPTINIGSLSVINNANKTSYSFSGTCSENGESVNLTAPISASVTCASGAFNFSNLDVSAQADGTVTFTVSISDAAGNNVTDSDTAAKDTVIPTATINTLAVINNTNKTSYSFNGTCSANGDTITITAPASISGTTTCAGGAFSFTGKDVSAEADGTVNFSVHIQDAAGNADDATTSTTKDTVDPTIAINTLSVINNANKASYAFSGTCSENGQNVTITAPASISGTAVCTSGAFSFSGKDLSAEADGSVTFTVSTSDTAGNAVTGSNSTTKDTVDPTVTINALSVINNANKVSYAFSGTCSANGDTVTIAGPASISGSTTCSSGTFSFSGKDLSAEADGTVTIFVQASDAAGNTAQDNASATKDTSDPTIAINALDVINNANKTSYAFSGTCSENGQTVTITAPASISGTTTCASGTFSFSGKDVSAETDGTVTFTVSTTDAAGNTGTGSNTATKDTSNPTIAISTMTAINNTNKGSYSFTGTCSENGQTVTITAPSSIAGGTTTCASGSFSFSSKNVTAETDGTVTFTVSTTDAAGNTGTGSNTALKDVVVPTVAISAMSVINNSNKTSYAFSGTCTANGDTIAITAPSGVTGSTACSGGAFSFTGKDVSAQSDGTVTFTVSATDAAGNTGTGSNTATKDTVNPTVTISAMSAINNANKTSYGFSGTCSENGQLVTITAPAGIAGGTATCTTGAFSFSNKDLSASSDGTVTFTVSTVDAAGNTGTGSNTATKDVVVPTVAISAMSVINNANKTSYSFSGTCTANGDTIAITAPAGVTGSTTCASGTFSFTGKDVSASSDGTVTFTVSATDAVGNSANASNTATKDTVNPTISISAMSAINNANKAAYGFSGTCSENGQTVTITAPTSIAGGTATCTSNAFSFTNKNVTAETDGTVTFTVSTTDAAGNTGSGSNTATKDTVNPTVTISTMSAINNANKAAYSFSGTCTANGDTIAITAPAVTGSTTCASGTYTISSINMTSIPDGTVNFTVTATDAVGNTGTGSNSATKDIVAPSISTLSLNTPASSPGNNTTPIIQIAGTFPIGDSFQLFTDATCTTSASASTAASSANSVLVTSSTLSVNQTYTFFAKGTDAAGNTSCSGAGISVNYTLDTVAPTVSITAPGYINNSNKTAFTFNGTCSQNGDMITITGPAGITGSTTCASSAFSFTKDFSSQADGTVSISVQASDTAGNTAIDSKNATKDTVNPTVANGTLNYITPSNMAAYSFSGTCSENGQTITLSAPISSTTTCASGSFTFSNLDLSALGEGNNSFTTTISDVAGNTGSDSDTGVKDTVAPTTPACVSVATDGVPARSNTQTWTGSTDATSGINYYEMSLGISAAADTIAWTSAGASVSPYQFTGISPVLLYETLYRFYIRARDNAGNISSVATCTQWELKRGYGVFKGTQTTNSTTLNQTTAYALQYSASSFNSQYFTHSTSTNSQNITIQYAGNYILSSSIPVYRTTTNTGVASLTATVKVNGTAVNRGYSANSFTAGSTTSPRGSGNNMSIILENLAVNDVITIETVNNALATEVLTVPSGKQFSTVLEYVPAESQVFTGTGTTLVGGGTNFNPASSTKILWTESIKGSNYTHSNSTNPENITLTAAGNYLVSVNIPVTGALTSGKPTTTIFVGGSSSTTNNGTSTIGASAFISNTNSHTTSSANYTNIIYGVTAGQVLDVRQVATTAGTLTVPAGKVATIYIQKLDTSSDYYIGNGTTTSWNTATTTNVGWVTDKQIDTSIFTHSTSTNTHQITALAAGDYMLFFSDYITSTTSYTNPIVYVLVNGAATPVGVCKAHHNLSTNTLRPMTCNLQTMLTLSANDVVSMTTIRDVTTGTASNSGVPRLTIRKISN